MSRIFVLLLLLFIFLDNARSEINLSPLVWVCHFEKPNDIIIEGPTGLVSKSGDLYLLPLSQFATKNLFIFDILNCKFKKVFEYPEEAMYCYIPKNDTLLWKKLEKNPLFCYPCTFSFRRIFSDYNSGDIYASVFTLEKIYDSTFKPIPLFFELGRNKLELKRFENNHYQLYGTFGSITKKGDTLALWGSEIKKIQKKGHRDKSWLLCLYNYKSNEVIPKVHFTQIEKELNTEINEFGPTLFLDDTLLVFYAYSETPPIILNLKNNKYQYLKYCGQMDDIKTGNFSYTTNEKGDSIRTFLLRFLPHKTNVVLVGGKNKGTQLKNFKMDKIIIQYYDKTKLTFQKEITIDLPQDKYQFFDCFPDPNLNGKYYFLLYTADNKFDLFYVML